MNSVLLDYIRENQLLSDAEISLVDRCLNDIAEMVPSDKPSVFKKSEVLIQDSENLAWCIFSVKQQLGKIQKAYRMIKDPEYVILVRQGRPSSEAINSEIRFKNEDVYSLEEKLSTVENIIEYLNHIQISMERYIYLLKDKLKYAD